MPLQGAEKERKITYNKHVSNLLREITKDSSEQLEWELERAAEKSVYKRKKGKRKKRKKGRNKKCL